MSDRRVIQNVMVLKDGSVRVRLKYGAKTLTIQNALGAVVYDVEEAAKAFKMPLTERDRMIVKQLYKAGETSHDHTS